MTRIDFAGTAIDGPARGRHIVQGSPRHYCYQRRMMPLPTRHNEAMPDLSLPIIEYRWSYSLGQWAMVY